MKVEITRYSSGENAGSIEKKEIRIDHYDTWSIAHTLAPIIAPMMKQIKETSHGVGMIQKEDVPEFLHSTYDEDGFSTEAWDWVLDEIFWAMNEIATDYSGEPSYFTKTGDVDFSSGDFSLKGWESTPESESANAAYHKRIQQGCKLFGIYFQTLWD